MDFSTALAVEAWTLWSIGIILVACRMYYTLATFVLFCWASAYTEQGRSIIGVGINQEAAVRRLHNALYSCASSL